jgi:hypothetical protein
MKNSIEDILRCKEKKVHRVNMEPLPVLTIEGIGFTDKRTLQEANIVWGLINPEDLPRISLSNPNEPLILNDNWETNDQAIKRILAAAAKKSLETI